MNRTTFEAIEENVTASADRMNKVDDCKSYTESLDRPISSQYVAMPDGTIQFVR